MAENVKVAAGARGQEAARAHDPPPPVECLSQVTGMNESE